MQDPERYYEVGTMKHLVTEVGYGLMERIAEELGLDMGVRKNEDIIYEKLIQDYSDDR